MKFSVDANDGEVTLTFIPLPHDIAELITFENSHLVAQHLTSNPEVARALYNELSYWAEHNQI